MSSKQVHTAVPFSTTATTTAITDIVAGHDKKKKLKAQGFTKGMIRQLDQLSTDCLLHIWILDNSASTNQTDGLRMVSLRDINEKTLVKCTRWDDIIEAALYHAQMAMWFDIPTTFRLLNACPDIESEFSLAVEPYTLEEEAQGDLLRFQQWLKQVQPTGRTPLTTHIYEIRTLVRSIISSIDLLTTQHVVLIIATDGFPSNERGFCNDEQCELFRKSLKSLDKLPIQIVFRLNTNNADLRKFYSQLRFDLKFRIVTMNALFHEAQSIHLVNDWLTYSQSLHRMREFGAVPECVDFISERELKMYEMRDFLIFLFSYEAMSGIVDPTKAGWPTFIAKTKRSVNEEMQQWDPYQNKFQPMLNVKRLSEVYGPSGKCTII